MFDAVAAAMDERYPGRLDHDQPWIFSNAGGAMIQMKLYYASGFEYIMIWGTPIGSVPTITLTPDGQARLELDISNSAYTPLRQGTIATIRNPSLTSVASASPLAGKTPEVRAPGRLDLFSDRSGTFSS